VRRPFENLLKDFYKGMNKFQLTMGKFLAVLTGSYYISSILTALDTAMIVFLLSYASLIGTVSNPIAAAIGAILFTGGIIYMIEVVATIGILPILESFKQKPSKDQKKQLFYGLIYLFLLSSFSMGISFGGRTFVGESIIPHPTMINAEGITTQLSEQSQNELNELNATIAKAESERKTAINASGNGKLRELASDGNGWAKGVLEKERKKAAAPYTAAIATLSAQKLDIISGTSNNKNKIITTITEANARAVTSADNLRNGISGFMMWSSIVLTCATWITGFVMAGLKATNGTLNNTNTTPPDEGGQREIDDLLARIKNNSPPTPHEAPVKVYRTSYQPLSFTPHTEKPVITTEPPVITNELEDLDIERDSDTNCITAIKEGGVPMDKTKMNEFFLTYKKRAEDKNKEYGTRIRNYMRAQELNLALFTIHGVERRHVVTPEKPQKWEQQTMF
jgi:hypothetical protein